jgi:glycosyltransferase involved in cell wall biosynthesis
MKICIFNQHLKIGGVETFLISLIKELTIKNIDVDLILLEIDFNKPFYDEILQTGANVLFYDQSREEKIEKYYDCVLVTNPETLVTASYLIGQRKLIAKSLLVGVYQTKMFCLEKNILNIHNKIAQNIFFHKISSKNIIYGNDACKKTHEKFKKINSDSTVIPLIVDNKKFPLRKFFQHTQKVNICSVGRLEKFKSYNIHMIDSIKKLASLGIDVHWNIYGDGELRGLMLQKAKQENVDHLISMHGSISYSELPRIYESATVFVGSGLSMMEAAASGVPTIPAIEYSEAALSFGFVCDIPGISFFEPSLNFPDISVENLISQLSILNQSQYDELSKKCHMKIEPFFSNNIATQYIDCFLKAENHVPKISKKIYLLYKISSKIHQLGKKITSYLRF